MPSHSKRFISTTNKTNKLMLEDIKKSVSRVKLLLQEYTKKAKGIANAKDRERAYGDILRHYRELATALDRHMVSLVKEMAKEGHTDAMHETGVKGGLVAYDPSRTKRYLDMLWPENGSSICAVFTDSMSNKAIRTLRNTVVDVMRQGVVEGQSSSEIMENMKNRWNEASSDDNTYRFVDKSNRRWKNSVYVRMLVSTVAQRVEVESHIDTLIENGFNLGRISSTGGADCSICKQWQGKIIRLAGKGGKYPTYEDAKEAGVFHPNCIHRVEYVDETELK